MKKSMNQLLLRCACIGQPLIAALALAACSGVPVLPGFTPYRMEIQQGNYVSQDMASKLKPGMTRDQVRFVLGTPLVADVFHADRWDYVFMREPEGGGRVQHRRLSVFFRDGKLARVQGDVVPQKSAQFGDNAFNSAIAR